MIINVPRGTLVYYTGLQFSVVSLHLQDVKVCNSPIDRLTNSPINISYSSCVVCNM
jgi:hypothetical protein